MKDSLIILLLFCFNQNSFSQSIFQTAYGNNDVYEVNALVKDSNNYYVIGTSSTLSPFDKDISFFCIDSEGGLLWSVTLGTDKNDFAKSLIRTSDGGFAISGETYGGLIDSTTSDLFLIKTDDQGFPLFAETYGGPANEIGGGLAEGTDGGFYISGTTSSYGNTLESAVVMRTDVNGNQLWTNVNSSMNSNYLTGILQKSNGDLYASGFCFNDINPVYNNYVVKIDTNGNLIQARRSGNSNQCVLSDLIFTNDGGYVTCGTEYINIGSYNMNVVKYDSSGNIVWNNIYGMNQEDAFALVEADNGDLIISGKSNVGSVGNVNQKSILLRLTNNGNIIWSKTYGYGSTTALSNSVLTGLDNSIVSAGIINDPGIGTNSYIIKADASGNSGCSENIFTPVTNTIVFNDSMGADWQFVNMTQFSFNPSWQSLSNQFTLYCFSNSIENISTISPLVFPNPGTGIFRIETGNYGEHSIDIYNSSGQKILHKNFDQKWFDFDIKKFHPGIYYFKTDNFLNGKIILTGK